MIEVVYGSPFVPPEWIAAHHLRPIWLPGIEPPSTAVRRGVCRCANMLWDPPREREGVQAIVLTTICDQMRYAAACLDDRGCRPVFLLNIPSTWQGRAVQQLFQNELRRLGRFLESVGGREPSPDDLRRVMRRYDEARSAVRGTWPVAADADYMSRLGVLRDEGKWVGVARDGERARPGVPLALVGGPLLADDFPFLELVSTAGGRIVLDASEWGERTLPGPLDPTRLADDPLGELARVYFAEIPDMFRRPNTRLYDWLGDRIATRGIRGLLFWRRLFCDLWHAELEAIRRWSPVPLLDIDVAEGDGHAGARTLGRLEAFFEMLP